MKVNVSSRTPLKSKIIQSILLLILWGVVFFLIALNLLFKWGIINDHLAPLYNLFNIEFTASNDMFFNISIALLLILTAALIRLAFLNFKGGKKNA